MNSIRAQITFNNKTTGNYRGAISMLARCLPVRVARAEHMVWLTGERGRYKANIVVTDA